MATKQIECHGFGSRPAHKLAATEKNFIPWALKNAEKRWVRCRECDEARQATSTKRAPKEPKAKADNVVALPVNNQPEELAMAAYATPELAAKATAKRRAQRTSK